MTSRESPALRLSGESKTAIFQTQEINTAVAFERSILVHFAPILGTGRSCSSSRSSLCVSLNWLTVLKDDHWAKRPVDPKGLEFNDRMAERDNSTNQNAELDRGRDLWPSIHLSSLRWDSSDLYWYASQVNITQHPLSGNQRNTNNWYDNSILVDLQNLLTALIILNWGQMNAERCYIL